MHSSSLICLLPHRFIKYSRCIKAAICKQNLIEVEINSYSLRERVWPKSSSSVSLLMVITLTAGLGEPAMKIACRCLLERDESGSSLTDASQQLLSCPSELWLSCASIQLILFTAFRLIIFGDIKAEFWILVFCNALLLWRKCTIWHWVNLCQWTWKLYYLKKKSWRKHRFSKKEKHRTFIIVMNIRLYNFKTSGKKRIRNMLIRRCIAAFKVRSKSEFCNKIENPIHLRVYFY